MMKLYAVLVMAVILFGASGCSGYQKAEAAYHAIDSVLTIAKNEMPVLQNAGIYSAQDVVLANKYIAFVDGLNEQYGSCVTNANNATLSKTSKFLDCLSVFANGLADPNELSALRIMNPRAQQRIQLYIVAFSTGLNIAISGLGGQQAPAPSIGPSAVAPTVAELHDFESRVRRGM